MRDKLYYENPVNALLSDTAIAPTCPPEQLRSFEVSCPCGKNSTANIPEDLSNRLTIHFCECGTLFGVKCDDKRGTALDNKGKKWIVERCPIQVQEAVMDVLGRITNNGFVN